MKDRELEEIIKLIKNMDGTELHKVINTILNNYNVCVSLNEPSIGGSAVSELVNGCSGFDWDSGKFILQAKDKLVKKKSK